MVTGVVVNCLVNDILDKPSDDAVVITHLPSLTEVMVDEDESTDNFYKIYTATSIEGYCNKRFIAVRQ